MEEKTIFQGISDSLEISKDGKILSTLSDRSSDPNDLTEDEQRQVKNLQKRDREVRAHEQAHLAAAAGLRASGPFYQYTKGPDGKKYATGGEVRIDNSPEKDPQETILKMQRVKTAALAPANPSAQDRSVATQASRTEAQARQQLAQERAQEMKENSNGNFKKEETIMADFSAYSESFGNSSSILNTIG